MDKASSMEVPRFSSLSPDDTKRYELYVFCNASQEAYGAVAYLRKVGGDSATSDIIYCKARVAPVKAITIPRLELLAAALGTRLIKFLKAQLPIALYSMHLHSDSSCVLVFLCSCVLVFLCSCVLVFLCSWLDKG